MGKHLIIDRDLIIAFKACLDHTYEGTPTPIQKAKVCEYIAKMGRTNTAMYERGLSDHDLFCREGMRMMALNIFDIMKRDGTKQPQERALNHDRRG